MATKHSKAAAGRTVAQQYRVLVIAPTTDLDNASAEIQRVINAFHPEVLIGTLTPTDDAANGEFLWEFAAGDVSEAGEFDVQFSAAFDPGPSPARTFVARWKVERYRTVSA